MSAMDAPQLDFAFEAPQVAPAHRWLAETVFVGLAHEDDGDVCIRFFALR